MNRNILFRAITALMFAIPFGLVAAVSVQAYSAAEDTLQCKKCHSSLFDAWAQSAHGRAMADPIFKASWDQQGQPQECLPCHTTGYDASTETWQADGITCEACHAPLAKNHPQESMPVDRTANLCGGCHQETVFEWQVSQHRQADLTCVTCHGEHSTTLKAEDTQALCAGCHRDRATNYSHSVHSAEGLLCADCHLGSQDRKVGEGRSANDHSFYVKLETCNACHEQELHNPLSVQPISEGTPSPKLDAMASVAGLDVSILPEPVDPIYYVLVSALVGMAVGLILGPWIERWYRRLNELGRPEDYHQ